MPLFGPPNIEKLKQNGDVDGLSKALRHKEGGVRTEAAKALGSLGDVRALEPLISTLADPDARVYSAGVRALAKMRDPQAVQALVALLASRDWDKQMLAAQALGDIHDAEGGRALCKVFVHSRRGGDEGEVRKACLEALRKIGGGTNDAAREEMLKALIPALQSPNKWVQDSAAEALASFRDARAVEPLLAALASADRDVISGIQKALSNLIDLEEHLVNQLKSGNSHARVNAAKMIGDLGIGGHRYGDHGSHHVSFIRAALREAMADRSDVSVRAAAIEAYARHTNIWLDVADDLATALSDSEPEVREAAQHGLAFQAGSNRRAQDVIEAVGRGDREAVRDMATRPGDIGAEALAYLLSVRDLNDSVAQELRTRLPEILKECEQEDTSHGGTTLFQLYSYWIQEAKRFLEAH